MAAKKSAKRPAGKRSRKQASPKKKTNGSRTAAGPLDTVRAAGKKTWKALKSRTKKWLKE